MTDRRKTNDAGAISRRKLLARLLGACAGVAVLPGLLTRRHSAQPKAEDSAATTEREASHYRALFKRGKDLAG